MIISTIERYAELQKGIFSILLREDTGKGGQKYGTLIWLVGDVEDAGIIVSVSRDLMPALPNREQAWQNWFRGVNRNCETLLRHHNKWLKLKDSRLFSGIDFHTFINIFLKSHPNAKLL